MKSLFSHLHVIPKVARLSCFVCVEHKERLLVTFYFDSTL